jgi:fructose-bisphosphate aldolase, class II
MNTKILERVPARIREIIGKESRVCLLSGRDVFSFLGGDDSIIMGCNPRIHHVIPGIMRAAEELDAVVAFELTKTEGGIDGGYTGQTPDRFVSSVIGYAEKNRFTKPFIIHADHVTVTGGTEAEIRESEELVAAQLKAGYTSVAVDASFTPLRDNIAITARLAGPVVAEGYGIEVELGDYGPDGASTVTTCEEAEEFLSGLEAAGITPQLLAINNGSRKGNYLEGEMVGIDLERTGEIFRIASAHGISGLVQHGITGTPLRIVGKLADYGIRKGNIGTLWQNVGHAGLPLGLVDAMRDWARSNRRDIKYATGVFAKEIDAIPEENIRQIHEMAYREAKEFISAFRAKGSASRLAHWLESTRCVS